MLNKLALFSKSPKLTRSETIKLSPTWEYVSDAVMGGISTGMLQTTYIKGLKTVRLTGKVYLENNGGFIQMAFDLKPDGHPFDASAWSGIEIDVIGNSENYDLRLRTDELIHPWQSYRLCFRATKKLTSIQLPFRNFEPHRTEIQLDTRRLRRIGVLAIGRAFEADVAVAAIRLIP